MKTLVLTTALVVLTAVTFAQNTKENERLAKKEKVSVEMYTKSNDLVSMKVEKEIETPLSIKVRDEKGNLLAQKWVSGNNNKTVNFDLGQLPNGDYKFEVRKRNKILYSKVVTKGVGIVAMSE